MVGSICCCEEEEESGRGRSLGCLFVEGCGEVFGGSVRVKGEWSRELGDEILVAAALANLLGLARASMGDGRGWSSGTGSMDTGT